MIGGLRLSSERWSVLLRMLRCACLALLLVMAIGGAGTSPAVAQEVPLGERIEQFSNGDACWGCRMFNHFVNVADDLGMKMSSTFSGPLRSLLTALMGMWVTFRLVQVLVNSTGSVDTGGILQDIIEKLAVYLVLMAVLSLGAYEQASKYLIGPFFDATSAFAEKVMAIGGVPNGNSCGSPTGSGIALDMGAGYRMMCSLHMTTGVGLGIGRFMIDSGFAPPFGFDFGSLFGGLILMIVFFILSVLLPFRLFDSLIRLVTVFVILPVLVVAAQFRISRGAARQGVSSVIVACLNFVFVAVAVAISLTLLKSIVDAAAANAVSSGGQSQAVGPLSGADFMLLIGVAFGMMAFIRMAGSLAAEFAGFQGQQGEVGSAAAGAVSKGSAAALGVAGYAVGRSVGAAGSAMWSRVSGTAAVAGRAVGG